MSRLKKLGLLSGILIVVCIATLLVTQMEEKKEEIKNSEEVILEVVADDVQKLSWEYDETKLAFHRNEDADWCYDEDEAFPVSDDKINNLLEIFESFGVSFVIEKVEDYEQYGLEEPVCTIRMETEKDSYEVKLGDFSTMDSKRYVSVGDGNVYLVNTDPLETFEIVLSDTIQNDAKLTYDNVSKIVFEGSVAYSIQYQKDSTYSVCDEDVYFTKTGNKNLPLDTDLVDSYLGNISSVDMSTYVTYHATDEDLQTYGLDNPELIVTVDYETEDGDNTVTKDSYILSVSRSAEAKAADQDEEDDVAYIRIGESGIIYEISSTDYLAFMNASYNDLRHQELLTADFEDVTKIDISLDGTEYTFTSAMEDDSRVWKYNDKEIEVDGIETALCVMTAISFTDSEPSGEEEISVTLHLEHEHFSEVKIVLYQYDGSYCVATLDGEPTSMIARSDMVELVEAVNTIILD